jgi:hypothetical protein
MAEVLMLRDPEVDLLPRDEAGLEAALRAAGATEVRFCDRDASGRRGSLRYVVIWVCEEPAGEISNAIGDAAVAWADERRSQAIQIRDAVGCLVRAIDVRRDGSRRDVEGGLAPGWSPPCGGFRQ